LWFVWVVALTAWLARLLCGNREWGVRPDTRATGLGRLLRVRKWLSEKKRLVRGRSNRNTAVKIVHTMIQTQFLQLAVFGAIFSGQTIPVK